MNRRAFLTALVAAPAAAVLLPGCSSSNSGGAVVAGPDMSGADAGVRAQDDLYRHVNGAWLKEYELPADKSWYGTGAAVEDRNTQWLREYIEGIHDPVAGSDEQKLRDLYDAALDLDAIERLGLEPIRDLLNDIDRAATKFELARVMGAVTVQLQRRAALDPCSLFEVLVLPDSRNAGTHAVLLGQAGIALAYSVYRTPNFGKQLDAYRTELESLATTAGFTDPAGMAQRVVALETRIAAEHWEDARLRDVEATYNRFAWRELATLAPGFEWDAWLAGLGGTESQFGTVIVGQPSYFTAAAQLWEQTDIAIWREYLKLGVVREYAGLLSSAFADADFAFAAVRMGLTERPARRDIAFYLAEQHFGDVLSKWFVAKHFSDLIKQRVEEMVTDIVEVYRIRLREAMWMSPDTRATALAKLDRMAVGVGYPETWQDYSGLTITKGQLVTSIRASLRFQWQQGFAQIGTPVRASEWRLHAHTVEAMYHPNAFELPAGILQPPFFDPHAAAACNYGAIGATIGHEIGHAFDDQGSHYDADNTLRDWWTAVDRVEFERRMQVVVSRYDGLVPEGVDPPNHVDGARTVGENSADIRGLTAAVAAYRRAQMRLGVDHPDYAPLFLAYARAWRRKTRPELLAAQLASDTHSPTEFRVNEVVRHVPEFYQAFGVKEGDKLYLAPDARITL
ncbi:M13 family metallopeptidase [Nocardia sp. NPDC051030]|uniref:M13 family metallopeptidase n=1 Tax=Nocardia sp. NPDC051030 TaxID=3155162 RepID=UPI00342D1366